MAADCSLRFSRADGPACEPDPAAVPATRRLDDSVTLVTDTGPLTDARWTCGRAVTDLGWQSSSGDVLFASYARRGQQLGSPSAPTDLVDPDGIVGVWDVARTELQRTLFHTVPLVSLVAPHPLSPSMVLAGSTNGDIVSWDTRSRTMSPVLRTESSTMSPIRSLQFAGPSSPFVISAAGDGVVSVFSLSQLSTPIESTVVRERGLRDVRIGAMGIPASAAFQRTPGTDALGKRSAIMVGGEDGGLYRVENAEEIWTTRHAGSRHDSPVTSVSCHPGASRFPQLGDLAATASIDGTVGVWSFGRRGAGLQIARLRLPSCTPASGVHWNPAHPGVFAVCDVAGGVSIYDISRDESDMFLGRKCPGSGSGTLATPLNRLGWNGDGSILASGSLDGGIHLWRAADAVRNPEGSAWEAISASAKQWRAQAASSLGVAAELEVPSSYVFRSIPPVFNPLAN